MTNAFWEIVWIFAGFIVLSVYAYKRISKKNMLFYLYFISYFISVIVIEMSPRGAMYFGDGYTYYMQAKSILDSYNLNLAVIFNPGIFINASQSWHYIPTLEFTIFLALFSSTKCIAVFHTILIQISAIIWYRIFKRIDFDQSGFIAASIILISLYIRNFTIPALKDGLVFYLASLIVYYIVDFYFDKNLLKLIRLIVPVYILTFTRMYMAAALLLSLGIYLLGYVKNIYTKKLKRKDFFVSVILLIFIICFVIVFRQSSVYAYMHKWVDIAEFSMASTIFEIIKRMANFVYGPFILNLFRSQSLYWPAFIASFVRLLATPFFIRGLFRMISCKYKNMIFIILVLPMLFCMFALGVGEQESSIRQYMPFYPLLCLIYGLGVTGTHRDLSKADLQV